MQDNMPTTLVYVSQRLLASRVVLTVLTSKIRASKPQVRAEYTTSFMHIFYTNKVLRVVLQFLWTGTNLGGNGANVPHEPGTAAPPGTAGLARVAALPGAAGPALCHVLGPNRVLPPMHNLDERD
jgi:hypothetical protein